MDSDEMHDVSYKPHYYTTKETIKLLIKKKKKERNH